MDCKGHCIPLPKRYDLGAALHARPLFRQDELAHCEVHTGLREEDCDLDRECEIAVKILVETVESPGTYCSRSGVGRVWPASRHRLEELTRGRLG